MPIFKIATWNVNSLRVRLPHVLDWLNEAKPDVLALQEIKMVDEDFPLEAINAAGYSATFAGQKTYNGVAVLSKQTCENKMTDFAEFVDPQRRVLGVTIGDIRVLNLYIPNGDHVGSEKYQYKLNWLQQLDRCLKSEVQQHKKMIVVGDFNIAPHEIDVHDPALWDGKVLFSPPERQAFQAMLATGFNDCFREKNRDEQQYSWWDYRVNAFKRNLGMRIDHVLATAELMSRCLNCYIDKTPRGWERPSDHTPVVAEFEI